jgi:hypothetical protein
MQAELTGLAFSDSNGNGQQDQHEGSLAGASVELLDHAGRVIATTVTDGNGRYRLPLRETGNYRVRVVLPPRMFTATRTHDALVSRGDVTLQGMDFGLQGLTGNQSRGQTVSRRSSFAPAAAQSAHAASVDAVFASL